MSQDSSWSCSQYSSTLCSTRTAQHSTPACIKQVLRHLASLRAPAQDKTNRLGKCKPTGFYMIDCDEAILHHAQDDSMSCCQHSWSFILHAVFCATAHTAFQGLPSQSHTKHIQARRSVHKAGAALPDFLACPRKLPKVFLHQSVSQLLQHLTHTVQALRRSSIPAPLQSLH